jgi:signal transduction histidine kinase
MLTLANILIRDKKRDTTGFRMINEAKSLATNKDYTSGVAQAMLMIGNYYSSNSELAKSMDAFEQLIRYAPTMENPQKTKELLRSAYNNLGGIYNRHGDFPSSLENRLMAISIVESMENPTPNDIFITNYNAASDFRQLKQYDKAREYLLKIEHLLPEIKPFYPLEYYYEFYQLLVSSEEVEKARQILHKYDSSLKVLNLSPFQRLDYSYLSKKIHGMFEMEYTKNYGQAIIYFHDELLFAREIGTPSSIISAEHDYAKALYASGNYRAVIEGLDSSYHAAVNRGLNGQALRVSDLLSQAYDKVNDHKKAYEFARIAIQLQDSVTIETAAERVNYLEAKYQHEKREKEIAVLQKDNQEKAYTIRKKNWLIVGAILLAALLATLVILIARHYKNRQKLMRQEKELQEEKIANMEKQQQVVSLQSMINGQESERSRIARDLHDGLGGLFSTVKMHYSTLQHDTPILTSNPIYRKTMDLLNTASDELRRVAHNMMPEVLLKVGLNEALIDLCTNISSGKLLKITYQSYGMEKRLSPSTEVMLYRIIQELVNNIIKHADANSAIIQINREGSRLSLTIEDNGRGFDTDEAERNRSMGMSTVKSRVDYLNGSLSIDSRKDLGTTVMIEILLNEN